MHSIYLPLTVFALSKRYINRDSVNGKVMNGLNTTVSIVTRVVHKD